MKREDIAIVAQLLTSMRDAVDKLNEAQRKKSLERAQAAKKEIMRFQSQLDALL